MRSSHVSLWKEVSVQREHQTYHRQYRAAGATQSHMPVGHTHCGDLSEQDAKLQPSNLYAALRQAGGETSPEVTCLCESVLFCHEHATLYGRAGVQISISCIF